MTGFPYQHSWFVHNQKLKCKHNNATNERHDMYICVLKQRPKGDKVHSILSPSPLASEQHLQRSPRLELHSPFEIASKWIQKAHRHYCFLHWRPLKRYYDCWSPQGNGWTSFRIGRARKKMNYTSSQKLECVREGWQKVLPSRHKSQRIGMWVIGNCGAESVYSTTLLLLRKFRPRFIKKTVLA